VPGGSSSGVQTCWSSAEAQEANLAVYDVLGGGSSGLQGVPIGTSIDFRGTPLTIPTNFLFENGAAVSRTSYSALFTALTVQTTGNTTASSASITGVPTGITQYLTTGMAITLTNSGCAIYTISSVGSTTITLNTGVGVTAGTAGGIIIYPHGAGDGSTTFNLPDSQGRATVGQGQVGSNSQPTMYVGRTGGDQTVTISQSNLPTTIGTAAAQSATVHDSGHNHQPAGGVTSFVETANTPTLYLPNSGAQGASFVGTTTTVTTGVTVTNSTSSVTNSGGGSALNVESPYSVATKIIRVQ
jgi:microcystin-dependent protein